MTPWQPSKSELSDNVRHILLHDWDPIGICEIPEASDEYTSYVGGVCSLLIDGADAFSLRQHLAQLETVGMGLSAPSEALDDVVKKLLTLVGR